MIIKECIPMFKEYFQGVFKKEKVKLKQLRIVCKKVNGEYGYDIHCNGLHKFFPFYGYEMFGIGHRGFAEACFKIVEYFIYFSHQDQNK